MQGGFHWGTGRRKTSVARIRIREGTGIITVNGKPMNEYFPMAKHQVGAQEPLKITKTERTYDIWASLLGGGISGQVGAMVMGLGRALCKADPELTELLRERSILTRDSRMVERKKYGRKKARKSFQFSKR